MNHHNFCKITEGELRRLTPQEKEKYETKYEYVVLSECVYEYQDKKIVVPVGFLTDGSSGGPDYGSAWIFHDYLYATHTYTSVSNKEHSLLDVECSREEADFVFVQVLRHQRMFAYARVARILSSLNFFWLFSRAWERSGKRGPEYLTISSEAETKDDTNTLEKDIIIE